MPSHFDGFTVRLFYDEPDQDWVVHFLELPTVSAFGDITHQTIEQLHQAAR